MKIGTQIAAFRKQRGITQAGLAKVLGVSSQSVSKWELGICCPDVSLLPEIASYFAISIDELMGYQPSWQLERDADKEPSVEQICNKVEENMNKLVDAEVNWTKCASYEDILQARRGNVNLRLTQQVKMPEDWLINPDNGNHVLCLAGAGGVQGPILAAAGYDVTVFDLSEKMLEKDRMVAEKEKLTIHRMHGNMCDMKELKDSQFDMIINPASMMYVPDVKPVMKECYRVLKKGGVFIFVAPNPINYYCDYVPEGGYYKACNRMPYKSYEHENGDWMEFGHTMEDYLGGAMKSGFTITGYYEDQYEDITELWFCVRAEKN